MTKGAEVTIKLSGADYRALRRELETHHQITLLTQIRNMSPGPDKTALQKRASEVKGLLDQL